MKRLLSNTRAQLAKLPNVGDLTNTDPNEQKLQMMVMTPISKLAAE